MGNFKREDDWSRGTGLQVGCGRDLPERGNDAAWSTVSGGLKSDRVRLCFGDVVAECVIGGKWRRDCECNHDGHNRHLDF